MTILRAKQSSGLQAKRIGVAIHVYISWSPTISGLLNDIQNRVKISFNPVMDPAVDECWLNFILAKDILQK